MCLAFIGQQHAISQEINLLIITAVRTWGPPVHTFDISSYKCLCIFVTISKRNRRACILNALQFYLTILGKFTISFQEYKIFQCCGNITVFLKSDFIFLLPISITTDSKEIKILCGMGHVTLIFELVRYVRKYSFIRKFISENAAYIQLLVVSIYSTWLESVSSSHNSIFCRYIHRLERLSTHFNYQLKIN
jgi:hypothetical protein